MSAAKSVTDAVTAVLEPVHAAMATLEAKGDAATLGELKAARAALLRAESLLNELREPIDDGLAELETIGGDLDDLQAADGDAEGDE